MEFLYFYEMKDKIKIGVIIPDRGDRPKLLKNCLRMLDAQTIQPWVTVVVNHKPYNDFCDITQRYRMGYDSLRNCGLDCIFLIENDDYYSPDYLQIMVDKWVESGKPEILGTNYTIYYHIKEKAYFTMKHERRASAMNTMLKPDIKINWPVDHEPYTDLFLWKTLKGFTFSPPTIISIGIKHGIGLCGGRNHNDYMHRYINKDSDSLFLREYMDDKSFNFYTNEAIFD